jgi:hypothetical protein
MDVVLNTLKALPSIAGSPLAILAYFVVIGVWLLSYLRTARFRLLVDRIKTLPEADRRRVLEAEMNTVIPQSITAEEWLRSRRQLYVTIAYVLTLLAVVFLVSQAYLHRGEAAIDDVKVKSSDGLGLIGGALAETAGAGVDEFSRRADSTKHDFKFDLVLRNSFNEPITVTAIKIIFDPDDAGFLSGAMKVSETYIVMLGTDGRGTVSSTTGEGAAKAWYPNPDGHVLIVTSQLRQELPAQSTDRFVVEIRFPNDYVFKGPMRKANLSLTWNGNKTMQTSVSLDQ